MQLRGNTPDIAQLKRENDTERLYTLFCLQEDPQLSQSAALALGALSTTESLRLLEHALHHTNETIREQGATALAGSSHAQAIFLLIHALKDNSRRVRKAAIFSLGAQGAPETLDILLSLVNRQDTHGNEALLHALAQIGKKLTPFECHTRIVVPLGEILKDIRDYPIDVGSGSLELYGWEMGEEQRVSEEVFERNARLKDAIFHAFEEMEWSPDRSHIAAEYWIWKRAWDKCLEIGSPAGEPLVAAFKGKDEDIRQQAYLTLVTIGTPVADQLLHALSDDTAEMREAAYRALIKIGTKAVPELIQALEDAYPRVRRSAIEGLGQIGDETSLPAIILHLNDPHWQVRQSSHHVLLRFGEAAIAPLVDALWSEDEDLSQEVVRLLDELGWQPDYTEAGARYAITRRQWFKCLEIGKPAVSPLLLELQHKDRQISRQALITLVKIGDSAVAPLVQMVLESSHEVAMKIVQDLAIIGGRQARIILEQIRNACDEHVCSSIDTLLSKVEAARKNKQRQMNMQAKQAAATPFADGCAV
jgi:HEAT repeat protein